MQLGGRIYTKLAQPICPDKTRNIGIRRNTRVLFVHHLLSSSVSPSGPHSVVTGVCDQRHSEIWQISLANSAFSRTMVHAAVEQWLIWRRSVLGMGAKAASVRPTYQGLPQCIKILLCRLVDKMRSWILILQQWMRRRWLNCLYQ